MSEVPTHDYQCPCDMCEPEAHSVAEYPRCDTAEQTGGLDFYGAAPIATGRKRSAPTMKPGAADIETAAFESLVKQVGEGKARWSRLLELLESERA